MVGLLPHAHEACDAMMSLLLQGKSTWATFFVRVQRARGHVG